ncbi:DnaJ domain-containing protein [Coccidioides immitis RS]|uniref:DnaJ domain-containing protein n=1 Tax=Coccidioides immitis (strain RS) TaxID=246410 RepID=J3K896_COCIM|nr:DnaJ domain-containing protein [Coccidioides immitis RS]EAS31026.3 DnaJ domain-containing protein [Coccidioides immitis RS]TPX23887.1 hypothetical protein DIZ76_013230 [Coccidioides immitis]
MSTRSAHGEFDGDAGGHEEGLGSGFSEEEEYEKIMAYPEDLDYYSLLALPRDPPPTEAQIRSAYRTLTLSLHPDKQPPHLREIATKHFDRIRQAHDTLIDPHKRVVYDMVGEEGVKHEWGVGGMLGRGGEAERKQIGIKTMDVEQFRRWFLRSMKLRELKYVDQLVQSKGTVSIKINAHGLAMRMLDPSIAPDAPLARMSSMALGFNFKTPFAPMQWLRQLSSRSDDDQAEEENEDVPLPNEHDAELEIHVGVGGKLAPVKHFITLMDPETQEKETKEVTIPHVLMGEKISLGATLRQQIHIPVQKSPALSALMFPLLGDSVVEIGTSLFPSPAFQTSLSRRIQPIKGTRPLDFTVQGLFSDMSMKSAPIINTTISRGLGARGLTYCNLSTGKLSWPSFIQGIFSSLPSGDNEQPFAPGNASKFEIGYVALPVKRVQDKFDGADDDDEGAGGDLGENGADRSSHEPLETWGFQLHSSPFSMQLSMNYARSFFGGKLEEPYRSEWNYEGYHPQKRTTTSRAVRLEVTTTVDVDLSFGWMVSGSRQVSNFTRMGLGVGVQGGKGLVCSLTWYRLGQSIKIPIALCPLEHLDGDVSVLAVMIPWIAYSIVEFGFLRPRNRRRQKLALARERKRLKALVSKRKAESIQAINLMREQVQRRQAREADRNGLVILEAQYGYVSAHSGRRRNSSADDFYKLIDVTIPVAALVDQGQLAIPSQVIKSKILGFYDPAPLLPKVLKIRYLFAGEEHAVEVNDTESVTIPMRSHML